MHMFQNLLKSKLIYYDNVSFVRVKLFKFTCVCPLQLEKCGVEFDELHVKYNQLYCASFDADPATLASLNMYPYAKEFLVIVVCFIMSTITTVSFAVLSNIRFTIIVVDCQML